MVKKAVTKVEAPKIITVDANLFRLAATCISTDGGRWYLSGVYIEPHAKHQGVTMVATDGHRMIVIYDEEGHADRPAIIALSKDMLKACRTAKTDFPSKRVLSVNCDSKSAQIILTQGNSGKAKTYSPELELLIAGQGKVEVEGEFPNWRKVVPTSMKKTRATAGYEPTYLASFGEIGLGLSPKSASGSTMCIHCDEPTAPGLVMWQGVHHAFGVIMPKRVDDPDVMAGRLPEWFIPPPVAPAPEPIDVPTAPAAPAAQTTPAPKKKPAPKTKQRVKA